MRYLYFGMEDCCQCRAAQPKFEAACKAAGVDYTIVDCEEDSELADRNKIRSIPYVVVLDDEGNRVDGGLAADMIGKIGK